MTKLTLVKTKGWKQRIDRIKNECVEVFHTLDDGPIADISSTLMDSFKIYTDQLETLTKSDSAILSSNAVKILDGIASLSKSASSPSNVLLEFGDEVANLSSTYSGIVSELSCHLPKLTRIINDIIIAIGNLFVELVKHFRNWLTETDPIRKAELLNNIDLEPIMKNAQRLTNTATTIASIVLINPTTNNDTYEAKLVLTLIVYHVTLMIEGVNALLTSEIHTATQTISNFEHAYLLSLHPFVQGMTDTISTITDDVKESVKVLSTSLAGFNQSLNRRLIKLAQEFSGRIRAKLQ